MKINPRCDRGLHTICPGCGCTCHHRGANCPCKRDFFNPQTAPSSSMRLRGLQ